MTYQAAFTITVTKAPGYVESVNQIIGGTFAITHVRFKTVPASLNVLKPVDQNAINVRKADGARIVTKTVQTLVLLAARCCQESVWQTMGLQVFHVRFLSSNVITASVLS